MKKPPVIRYWNRRWSGSLVRISSAIEMPMPVVIVRGRALDRAGDDAGEPEVEQLGPPDDVPTRSALTSMTPFSALAGAASSATS